MADSDAVAASVVPAEEEAEALQVNAAAALESFEPSGTAPFAPDHKRKLSDLESYEDEEAPLKKQDVATDAPSLAADESAPEAKEIATGAPGASEADPARLEGEIKDSVFDEVKSDNMLGTGTNSQDIDAQQLHPVEGANELTADGGHEVQKAEAPPTNGQLPSAQNVQQVAEEDLQKSTTEDSQQGSLPPTGWQPSVELVSSSQRIEVPNSKVGVLIGKAGDTIRYLQINSGAKIQITRDAEADPHSSTRPVELIGTLENINKAKQLIKDVIAEADAGGSPSLVARGFSTVQSGGEQTEIKVPNEKVGLVIGKGGETIKNLQTRSGARIQLIPQHLPEGDSSKERTVRITGNKKQIESAKEMIKEVMNQAPTRPSPLSGGYSQQGFRPRGPTGPAAPQWGPQVTIPSRPTMGNDYQQRGMYPPPQTTQYPQPYGGYSQLPPPRGGYSAGWDQRPGAPIQSTHPSGGYDYYGQGGQSTDSQPSNPLANPSLASTPAPVNYGHSQAPVYGQPTPYAQSGPTQQSYGHGYNEPKYDNQVPSQQFYGQQPISSQPGVYGQQAAPQPGYGQQQNYNKPSYGAPTQEMAPSYGPPRASQSGDPMYQGPAPSSYGSGAPTQQSYPYASSAPQQPAPAYNQTYGPTSGATDGGYTQPPLAGYPQHGGPAAPGYGQGGQPVPAYAQPGSQSGGYGQYPSSQQGYVEPVSSNVNYGYHGGSADSGYGNTAPTSGYGVPPPASGQPGYAQPPSNPSGYYEQSVPPQSAFGNHPGTAPAGYVKSVSPQPGYGGQYDSAQMYGHH